MIFPTTQNEIQESFDRRYESFVKQFSDLEKIIKFIVESVNLSSQADYVICFMLLEVIEDFNSVFLLCRNGLSRSAMKILRSQFEHTVTLAYLQKNQDEMNLFINWYDMNQHKLFMRLEEAFPQMRKDSTYLKKKSVIEENYKNIKKQELFRDKSKEMCDECKNKVCKKCKENFGKEVTKRSWSKDIISMAREAGISAKSTYFAYALPLTEAHPSLHSINRRINVVDNSVEHNPIDYKEESQILLQSHYLHLHSLETYSKYFLSEKEEIFSKLKLAGDSFTAIWEPYFTKQ